ncbi:MAG: hypothetical protein ISR75_05525 [Phycisphaerales bacterium]|nr:hypothetical protein [Planctomycetota bacterium]MBL6997880.1 hypothetical protein [Phycisphaerales bacterium]
MLTSSAIVIPAHQELQELQSKKNVIQENLADLEYRVEIYNSFLQDLHENDPEFKQRILDMQLNLQAQGTPVVIDTSASQTPLEWVAQRARRDRKINMQVEQSSILSGLSTGRSRLLLIGVGVFAMFIGFLKGPALSATDSTD